MNVEKGKSMTEKQITEELLRKNERYKLAQVTSIDELAGDASVRQYFKVSLDNAPSPTIILMKQAKTVGPLTTAGDQYTQDECFLELGPFLTRNKIRVPEILSISDDKMHLLVEDVGDVALWHFTYNQLSTEGTKIKTLLGDDPIVTLYKKAVDILKQLQSIAPDEHCVAFKRKMSYQQYRTESVRFIDHYLLPNGFPDSEVTLLTKTIDTICTAVAQHPETLIHRDFMPWNLQVSSSGEIIVIDFQDCCLASSTYDIMSLIHDRDADFQLGKDRIQKILHYYSTVMEEREDFLRRYQEVLLQRYFRLAGQFCLLTEKTGNPIYKSWVPGCFKRLGQTLAQMDDMSEVLDTLAKAVPSVQEGAEDPWALL